VEEGVYEAVEEAPVSRNTIHHLQHHYTAVHSSTAAQECSACCLPSLTAVAELQHACCSAHLPNKAFGIFACYMLQTVVQVGIKSAASTAAAEATVY
jgi:hypothetical protein